MRSEREKRNTFFALLEKIFFGHINTAGEGDKY